MSPRRSFLSVSLPTASLLNLFSRHGDDLLDVLARFAFAFAPARRGVEHRAKPQEGTDRVWEIDRQLDRWMH